MLWLDVAALRKSRYQKFKEGAAANQPLPFDGALTA